MDWNLLAFAGYALFGLAVGAYGTLIGAGGGFVIVPVLIILLGWDHQMAVGTSLVVVAANALSGSWGYWKQRRIDLKTGWQFALATMPGSVLGSYIVQYVSGRTFNIAFGVLLIIISLYLMFRPSKASHGAEPAARPEGIAGWGWTMRHLVDAQGSEYRYGFSMAWGLLLSLGVGFMSSIMGIGGGIIHVPVLVTVFGFPAHVATATSLFVLSASATVGGLTHLTLGHVLLVPGALMAAGAVTGAQLSARYAHRIRGPWLIRALATALTIVGGRLVVG